MSIQDILRETEVFPFVLACNEKGWSDHAFRDTFLKAKPEGLTWYGYDVIVLSRTEVEFHVYDMMDFCHGGLGNIISKFKTKVDPRVTHETIKRRIFRLAAVARDLELMEIEQAIIAGYAAQIEEGIG